jgi:orotate phosphoribosyltransferase
LIIDDVITAGTAIREVTSLLDTQGAQLAGVLIGLNRQERGKAALSAIQEVERDFGVPVISIIKLGDIMNYLEESGQTQWLDAIKNYRNLYGVSE